MFIIIIIIINNYLLLLMMLLLLLLLLLMTAQKFGRFIRKNFVISTTTMQSYNKCLLSIIYSVSNLVTRQ